MAAKNLKDLLIKQKPKVLQKWFDLIVGTYPPESSVFLKNNTDMFANPVGQTIHRGIEELYDLIISGADTDGLKKPLESIVKIRAVQDFKPSDGIAFIFLLKKAIRESLVGGPKDSGFFEELFQIDSQVDEAGMIAFDIYVECARRLYEIRVAEIKDMMYMLLKRANVAV